MANLLGQNIGANYRGILNLDTVINTFLKPTLSVITDGMGNVSALQLSTTQVGVSTNGLASISPLYGFGTWFSGGTATTTKPYLLIEPSGTTSTAWNTSGTGLGINASSGFLGNLIDLQRGGTSQFSVSRVGAVTANGDFVTNSTGGQLKINDTKIGRGLTDGTLVLYDSTELNFNRLMFGGTGVGFPSIQRSGANLSFKLADDSGFCSVTAANVFASASFSTGSNIFHSTGAIYFSTNTNARLNIFADGYSMEVNGRTAISASALFTLNSTTKGFLPPRMTTAQINNIGTPAEGLQVYNTTINHMCFYMNGAWARISHSPM